MDQRLDVTAPFFLAQSLAFLRRFVPCQRDFVLTETSITAAVTVEGRVATFTILDGEPPTVRVSAPEHAAALVAQASHLVGAEDELGPLYAAAAGDPPFQLLVEQLHGLHHVRFLTLQEIAAYSVMMQRNPITRAAAMKRSFMRAFGRPVDVAGTTLHALPSLDELAGLDGVAIGEAIGHRTKGETIAGVLAGVARIGEPFLREAPYAEARDRSSRSRASDPSPPRPSCCAAWGAWTKSPTPVSSRSPPAGSTAQPTTSARSASATADSSGPGPSI